MQYILEIRDFTNEANELNQIKKDYSITVEKITKNIFIKASNHVMAIASYLKHMQLEVIKIINSKNVVWNNGNVIFNKYSFSICIEVNYYGSYKHKTFIYNSEDGLIEEETKKPLSNIDYKDYLLVLLQNWENIKNQINTDIQKYISDVSKSMTDDVVKLEKEKSIVENFII